MKNLQTFLKENICSVRDAFKKTSRKWLTVAIFLKWQSWIIMDYHEISWTIMDWHGLAWTGLDWIGLEIALYREARL